MAVVFGLQNLMTIHHYSSKNSKVCHQTLKINVLAFSLYTALQLNLQIRVIRIEVLCFILKKIEFQ